MGKGKEVEADILERINAKFKVEGKIQRKRRIWISLNKKDLINLCSWVKEQGFVHLSAISVTDWLKEGKYEITYHLWSYEDKVLLTLKTNIDRENPVIESVASIWRESAQIHERELHELFGVKFDNNPDLTPLFLEDWQGPAPFRKDFDWREYVREKYYNKENKREMVYYD
jgi:NADH-quinone oxidoreductase subunit C